MAFAEIMIPETLTDEQINKFQSASALPDTLSDDQLAQFESFEEPEEGLEDNFLYKAGNWIAETTGLRTVSSGIAEIIGAPLSQRVAVESAQRTNDLIVQAHNATDPDERRSLLLEAKKISDETQRITTNFLEKTPTPTQMAGGMATLGLNVALAGGAGSGGSLLAQSGKMGLLGAGLGASQAVEKNEDLEDVALDAIFSGVISSAMPIGLKGLEVGASKVFNYLNKSLPETLVRSALGQPKPEIRAGKDIAPYVVGKMAEKAPKANPNIEVVGNVSPFSLASKKIGSYESIFKESNRRISELSDDIDSVLLATDASKTTRINLPSVAKKISDKINSEGGKITAEEVLENVKKLTPQAKGYLSKRQLPTVEANKLRQLTDKTLGDRAFISSQLPFNKQILKDFRSALADEVKSSAEGTLWGTQIRRTFNELSKEITLRDVLGNRMAQTGRNQMLSLTDLVAILAGSPGGFAGGVAGLAVKKALQSPAVLTGTAFSLAQLQKLKPILEKVALGNQPLTDIERTLVVNLLKEITE